MSPQKFTELCRKVLGSDQADTLQQKAFGQFDKHNDGNINFRDFLMVVHLTSAGSAEDKLRTMFSLYDVDGNGSIECPGGPQRSWHSTPTRGRICPRLRLTHQPR